MAEEQESSSLTGEIETLRRQLRYYQEYDQLTGIYNKAAFCKNVPSSYPCLTTVCLTSSASI